MSEENTNTAPQAGPSKGLPIAGMVLGIVGLLFSFAGCTALFGLILCLVGVILSAIGMKKCNDGTADGKGMAIAGLATSGVGILISIIVMVVFAAAVGSAVDDYNDAMDDYYDALDDYNDYYNY
tara:strand:- start:38 stop:409 length:372 start_codon:yes stop_codon:yes gene_type:complete